VQAAAATIGVLADLYPNCIHVTEIHRTPLKVGIFNDILAATKGAVTSGELHDALRRYCASYGYLKACREGAARVDLNGAPIGVVTAAEAAHAANKIEKGKRVSANCTGQADKLATDCNRAADQQPKPVTPTLEQTNKAPRRLSLADLRAAARARREATP
jgi:ProP effector